MKYVVNWTQNAVDDLARVFASRPRDGQRTVVVVRSFGRDGHGDLKKLQGSNSSEWRLRAGDWRVILTIDGVHVWVDKVDNRRDAY